MISLIGTSAIGLEYKGSTLGGKARYTSYHIGFSLTFIAPALKRPVTLEKKGRGREREKKRLMLSHEGIKSVVRVWF